MTSLRGALALFLVPILLCATQLGCGGDEELPGPDLDRPREERAPAASEPDAGAGAMPDESAAQSGAAPTGDTSELIRELEETVDVTGLYPEDGPLYPGVEPSKVSQSPDGKVTVMMGANAGPEEATDVILGVAEDQGWTIISHNLMGDTGSLVIGEKDGRKIRMLVTELQEGEAETKTLVAVSVDP